MLTNKECFSATTFVSNADIDECAMDTDNCAEIATCMNTPGSFSCTCNEGYTGDGTSCVGKHVPFVIPDLETIMFFFNPCEANCGPNTVADPA